MSAATTGSGGGLSKKGLAEGSVGLLGAIIIGVLLLISGLGFHHEVRRDRGSARGL